MCSYKFIKKLKYFFLFYLKVKYNYYYKLYLNMEQIFGLNDDTVGAILPIDIDPIANVPIISMFLTTEDIKIKLSSYIDKDFMINFIKKSLLEFGEEIKAINYYESEFGWKIEYGTKPLEEIVLTIREKNTIENGRRCALDAAMVAFEKFSVREEDITYRRDRPIMGRKLWASIIIGLGYCPNTGKYTVPISRIRGCKNSSRYFSKEFGDKIKLNHLWFLRNNYIKLLDGLPVETGRDNVLTYLLNEEIIKEVCSFMR